MAELLLTASRHGVLYCILATSETDNVRIRNDHRKGTCTGLLGVQAFHVIAYSASSGLLSISG